MVTIVILSILYLLSHLDAATLPQPPGLTPTERMYGAPVVRTKTDKPAVEVAVTPPSNKCYSVYPSVVYLPTSPPQIFSVETLERCRRTCWHLPGCSFFIFNHLQESCLLYAGPADRQRGLLKHEEFAEKACYMYSGGVSAACEEVPEIERFSEEEGALVLNLISNTCLSTRTRKDGRVMLNLAACNQAELWTLKRSLTNSDMITLRLKGTDSCIQLEESGHELDQPFVVDCTEDFRQEFLLRPRKTSLLGFASGKYCHRPISAPDGRYVYYNQVSRNSGETVQTLEAVRLVRKSQVESPCYWNDEALASGAAQEDVEESPESSSPPFLLPGEEKLVRCREGFGVRQDGQWHQEIRVRCTGNITQQPPTCLKKGIILDLMTCLNLSQATIICILLSTIIYLISKMKCCKPYRHKETLELRATENGPEVIANNIDPCVR